MFEISNYLAAHFDNMCVCIMGGLVKLVLLLAITLLSRYLTERVVICYIHVQSTPLHATSKVVATFCKKK